MIELDRHLQQHIPRPNPFDWFLNCQGKVHREIKHRRTVEFELAGKRYFIKAHRACGWGEIIKQLMDGHLPVISAEAEWRAIARLQELGVPTLTVAAKGSRGRNPAKRESFVVTEALEGMVSLEELTQNWGSLNGPRAAQLKRALLKKVARIAGMLHSAGLNHRDFYLCHFLVKDRDWKQWRAGENLELFLIDLHRVQIRARVPKRWRAKDLSGLLFSALDCGLTRWDICRFLRLYYGENWRQRVRIERRFWNRVWHKAESLYLDFHQKAPPTFH